MRTLKKVYYQTYKDSIFFYYSFKQKRKFYKQEKIVFRWKETMKIAGFQ